MSVKGVAVGVWDEVLAVLRWWHGQLSDVARVSMARLLPRFSTRLQLLPGEDAWSAWVLEGNERRALSALPMESSEACAKALKGLFAAPVTIGLDERQLLILERALPSAAARSLHTAVPLLLMRELPLSADRFVADWQIIARDRLKQQLTVRIWIARSADVQRYRSMASDCGLRVRQIGVSEADGRIHHSFLRTESSKVHYQSRVAARALAAAAIVLALAIPSLVAGQWLYERARVNRIERDLRPRAQAVQSKLELLAESWKPAAELQAIMNRADACDVIAALTRAIPPNAWVFDANMEARASGAAHIKIMGFAPSASGLAQVVTAANGFRSVTLINSLTDTANRERFQIAADWVVGTTEPRRTASEALSSPIESIRR